MERITHMYAPMFLPLAGLVAGIFCGLAGADWILASGLILAGICIYLILVRKSSNPLSGYKLAHLHQIWLFLIFAGIGVFDMDINRPYADDYAVGGAVAFTGKVKSVQFLTSGDRAIVEVAGIVDGDGHVVKPDNCRVILQCDNLPADVDDIICVTASLKPIQDMNNTLSQNSNRWFKSQGLHYISRCNETDVSLREHQASLTGSARKLRSRIETFIEKTALDKETQNFLITILLGDRSYLNPEMRDLFKDAGLSHILALSGMHVAIMAGIFMWLLFPINFVGLYKYRIILAAIMMLTYAYLTGLAPSTVRAAIMFLAVAVSIFMERKNGAWASLLLATFCILLADPLALFDVGLQLSFTCVAALIFFSGPLNPFSQHDHPWLYKVATAIITTMVATLATWCLTAYYFGTVPVMFLPVNIIALPLLPIYLTCSLAYLALAAFGCEPGWFTWLIDSFPRGLEWFVGMITNHGSSAIRFSPTGITVWLWLLLMVTLAMLLHGKHRRVMRWCAMVLGCGFIVTLAFPADADADNFMVHGGVQKIRISYMFEGKESSVEMPRFRTSETVITGTRIVCIDSDNSTCNEDDSCADREPAGIAIIGGSTREGLQAIVSRFRPTMVIIHPTVRRAAEAEMLHEADSLGIPAYSIRTSGPYRTRLPE